MKFFCQSWRENKIYKSINYIINYEQKLQLNRHWGGLRSWKMFRFFSFFQLFAEILLRLNFYFTLWSVENLTWIFKQTQKDAIDVLFKRRVNIILPKVQEQKHMNATYPSLITKTLRCKEIIQSTPMVI